MLLPLSLTNRRTLRVLFAIARGLWIVTEEWVYASLCSAAWADLTSHRHPRYQPHSTDGRPLTIFAGKSFVIGRSLDPPCQLLKELIQVAGGQVLSAAEVTDCDYLVMGEGFGVSKP